MGGAFATCKQTSREGRKVFRYLALAEPEDLNTDPAGIYRRVYNLSIL